MSRQPTPCDRAELLVRRMQAGLGMRVGVVLTEDHYAELKRHIRVGLDTEVAAGGPYLNDGWNDPAPETPKPADAARSAHRDSSNVRGPGLYSASNRPHGEV